MTTVKELASKLDKDGVPTLTLDGAKNPVKVTATLKARGRLTQKHKMFAAEAARVWAEDSGITWSTFTQNTTFHGIRYIFDNSPNANRSRRSLWVICVIAAALFFIVQVALRVSVYFEYNTNVDVEKVYTNTVPFPAVTICNQNQFRLTATSELDLYEFIDAVFGRSLNETLKDLNHYSNRDIDTLQFALQTAHQLEDLMDSCTWKGSECNLTTDWVTSYTDMGVCYTFNSGKGDQPPLEVTESGAGLGLSLILNIEQYEYMMGPQNDAGIKILLHDQSEFPMIKDLGFAVAPGTHTLVGVNRFVITSMDKPYGQCEPLHNSSMSDCRISCRAQEILKLCGCRDVYMPNTSETSICNMSYTFGCVKPGIEKLMKKESDCQCSVPCTRVNYEPALSYAQLSKLSVERLVLTDPVRKGRVKKQYQMANEMFQRVDSLTWQTDIASIKVMKQEMEALTEVVNAGIANQSVVESLILQLEQVVKEDYNYIGKVVVGEIELTIENIANAVYGYEGVYPQIFAYLSVLPNLLEDTDVLLTYLVDCVEVSVEPRAFDFYDYGGDDDDEGGKLQNVSECVAIADALEAILGIPMAYQLSIKALFDNTSADPLLIPEHNTCLEALGRIDERFTNATKNFAGLLRLLFEGLGHDNVTDVAKQLVNMTQSTVMADFLDTYDQIRSDCQWPLHARPDEPTSIVVGIFNAISAFPGLIAAYQAYKDTVATYSDVLSNNLNASLAAMDQYLQGTTTKLDMARVFKSFLVTKGLDDLMMADMNLRSWSTKMSDIFNSIAQNLKGCFEYSFELPIPMLNDRKIAELNISHLALSLEKQEIDALYDKMGQDPKTHLSEVVDAVIDSIEEPVDSLKEEISALSKTTADEISGYMAELSVYLDQSRMNQEFFMRNFLQVDIFYRELNTEYISQRASFAMSSLLGEVGGFLGLLLGASILTVCELIDYLTLSCLNKLRARKQTDPLN